MWMKVHIPSCNPRTTEDHEAADDWRSGHFEASAERSQILVASRDPDHSFNEDRVVMIDFWHRLSRDSIFGLLAAFTAVRYLTVFSF